MSSGSLCPICGQPSKKTCSGCHVISYCSVEHQKIDWKAHKKSCRLFEIKYNEKFGRYTVATKFIAPGTIIMNEPAIMIGPKQNTLPVCLGCNKNFSDKMKKYYCSKCLIFPMCGPECEKIPIHADNECQVFAKNMPHCKPIKDFEEGHPAYECIMTIRCLRLKETDPKKWKKLENMQHQNEFRKTNLPALWIRNEINTVHLLRDQFQMKEFSEEDIHTVLGYYDINSFEVKINQIETSGLFNNTFFMANDCISNTHHTFTDDFRMVVRATVPIKKSEQITTTYAHTLDGTLERRQDILDSKFFDCDCLRCSDPTEFGTFFSAVKCIKCSNGYLLPKNSLIKYSEWFCSDSKCQFRMGYQDVEKLTSKIRDEIKLVRQEDAGITQAFEEVLKKYSKTVLHPNHSLLIDVESSLLSLYGRMKGHPIKELSVEVFKRKEMLCRHVLTVLDVIEPGLSRIRGVTLYELHAAVYFAAEKKLENNEISATEFKNRLTEVLVLLQEAKIILSFDSTSTIEGITLYELHAALYFAANKSFDNNEITTSELKSRLKEILLILEEAKVILSFDSKSTMEGAIAKSIPGSITYITESIDKLIP